ncbi:hypothetical protein L3Q65_22805 [Amycolatopsis sp. FU40]|uniref:hypothetical protein n=1 Tax=Amycolatopsis sp. FU40 TaxID=2914159 RepID=UPI001F3A7857|nr:hypothetical protein [Amycolatopsis sp. FU40]UKD59430.1 hypothetical protein L3Q65_22805 [Amycolatopsis sp. FU40]
MHSGAIVRQRFPDGEVPARVGRRPDPVRLIGDRPVSPAAARRAIAYLREGGCADPELSQQPLLVPAASHLLATSV